MERVLSPFKFDTTEASLDFYEERQIVSILDSILVLVVEARRGECRIGFEGHADTIGTPARNDTLSFERARAAKQRFLNVVNKNGTYKKLKRIVENASVVGYSNTQPLYLDIPEMGRLLIGDNNKPIGRNLNRRVAIKLYCSPGYSDVAVE